MMICGVAMHKSIMRSYTALQDWNTHHSNSISNTTSDGNSISNTSDGNSISHTSDSNSISNASDSNSISNTVIATASVIQVMATLLVIQVMATVLGLKKKELCLASDQISKSAAVMQVSLFFLQFFCCWFADILGRMNNIQPYTQSLKGCFTLNKVF